jgi:hypothetical protein
MIASRSSPGIIGLLVLIAFGLCALPTSAQSDAEMEVCLAKGKILKGWEVLPGLTGALKLTLDCDGREQKAVFKSLDFYRPGVTVHVSGDREFNFSDRYQYEVAAYRVDRELGLGMVPVAVLRRHRGREGALVAWIPDTVHENQVTRTFNGVETASLARQMSIVRMFDSLIYNVDRRPPNTLVNPSTVRVYMIDHGRSFREKKELQEEFEQNRIWLTREIYVRLKALERGRLDELLIGLATRGQRKTLLVRRDLIVAKIDRERQKYGDEAVFVGPDQEAIPGERISPRAGRSPLRRTPGRDDGVVQARARVLPAACRGELIARRGW